MLKIDNIVVNYGNLEALHGITVEVKEHEIVALLGSNGAGKTTTINTVSGLIPKSSGSISFNGNSIDNLSASERVEKGIVQVPEGRKLFPNMTVLDNLIVGSFLPRAKKERKETLDLVFSIFPKMADRKDQMAGSLSGGEQQMCALGRALMSKPKLLMLDEPSLGLAPLIVDTVLSSLETIRDIGVTILLVEQNLLAALDIADRGYVIEVGSNVLNDTAKGLENNPKVKSAYLGI